MAKATNTGISNLFGYVKKGAHCEVSGFVPTGHFVLDFILHYGVDPTQKDLTSMPDYNPEKSLGLPLGKVVEIFGEEGGGKSSLAYRICGNAQKQGLTVAWIDTEHSFSENLAELNGCDISTMLYSNLSNPQDPDKVIYAENIIDMIIDFCKAKEVHGSPPPKVIVLDSLANLVPKARGEASAEQSLVGTLPRLLSDSMGKITQYAELHNVLVVFINQLREKVGQMWGNPETSPGGHSVKHAYSVRLQLTRQKSKESLIMMQDDNGNDVMIGGHAYVKVVKNRLAKPFFDSITIPIYYEPYFPEIEDIAFDTGRQLKIISVYKGEFRWGDVKIEGRKNFINHLIENKLTDKLIVEIKENAKEENVILPPEIVQYQIKNDDGISEEENADNVETEVSSTGKTENRRGRPRKSQKE